MNSRNIARQMEVCLLIHAIIVYPYAGSNPALVTFEGPEMFTILFVPRALEVADPRLPRLWAHDLRRLESRLILCL